MKHLKYPLLTCSLCVLSCINPPLSFADSNERAAPLHIKITPNKNTKTVNQINIQTSKHTTQNKNKNKNKKTEEMTSIPAEIQPEKTMRVSKNRHIDVKDILRSVSCKKSEIPEKNTIKLSPDQTLSDALRSYLGQKEQNTALVDTLYNVAKKTDTDFKLLVITAMIESDLGRVTISSKSTARGIYQYIEPTWLVLMKRYGGRIGYQHYSDSITFNAQTRTPEVKGGMITRQKILDLRYDNKIAALIKAYQIKDEKRILETYKNGQNITVTDHYIAHMLGLSLARTFYKLKNTESDFILANLKDRNFKEAVSLNKSFFYTQTGDALNASQAYVQFDRKISQKFDNLKAIVNAHSHSGVQVKGPTQCPPSTDTIESVSADDILSHDIAPLPQSEKTADPKVYNILTQVGSYAKTVKVKMVQSED